MRYPEDVVEEVRSRNDIVAVIGQYVRLTKKGGNYFGICPFHNEKTGSFSVSQGKQIFYCFGCGAGGNVITFLMKYDNLSFGEAMETLADRVGMKLPVQELSEEEKKRSNLREQLLQANKDAAAFYFWQLRQPSGSRAKAYFEKRGLTEETMQRFGLGYAPQSGSPLYKYLKKKGYSDELLKESRLLNFSDRGVSDRFWNRAMFPIMDARSRVIAFGGRVLGEGEPKYLNSPENPIFDKGRNLYGLHLAKSSRSPYMLLCEGYMDVIALHQAGFDCAVASLGTALTPGQAGLIKRYVTDVIITYDSDGAGQKAALRAIPILKQGGISVRVLDMRPYKDPDEFIKALGPEEYQKRIDGAVNAFFFEIDVMARAVDMEDPEKKTAFHKAVANKLTEFTDQLERENYLTAVAARYGIKEVALREMVNYLGGIRISAEPEFPPSGREETYGGGSDDRDIRGNGPGKGDGAESYDGGNAGAGMRAASGRRTDKNGALHEAERILLNYLASGQKYSAKAAAMLKPVFFSEELYQRVASMILEEASEGGGLTPIAILDRFQEDEELSSRVAAIFHSDLPENEAEAYKTLVESIKLVKGRYLDLELRSCTDPVRVQAIAIEKAGLQKLRL